MIQLGIVRDLSVQWPDGHAGVGGILMASAAGYRRSQVEKKLKGPMMLYGEGVTVSHDNRLSITLYVSLRGDSKVKRNVPGSNSNQLAQAHQRQPQGNRPAVLVAKSSHRLASSRKVIPVSSSVS